MAETEQEGYRLGQNWQSEAARIAISVLQSEIEVLNCELDKAYDYTVRLENQIKDEIKEMKETNRFLRDQLTQYRKQYGKLDDFWIQNER